METPHVKTPKEILNYYKRKRLCKRKTKKPIKELDYPEGHEDKCPPFIKKSIPTENKERRTHYSKLSGCDNVNKNTKQSFFINKDEKGFKHQFISETVNSNIMVRIRLSML